MKNARKSFAYSTSLLLFGLFFGFQFSSYAQDRYVDVTLKAREGKSVVFSGNKIDGVITPIAGVTITVINSGTNEQIEKKATGSDGNAVFRLELFKEYLVTASKNGFVAEKIVIDANAKGRENKAVLHYETESFILLYRAEESGDKLGAELLGKPFDKLVFSPSISEFVSDKDYQLSLKKEISKISPADRADLINKLAGKGTPTDPKAEEKYKKAIQAGDKAFSAKDYPKAKEAYTQALSAKPADKYATDQLKQIEFASKSANPNDAKYNDLIAQSDKDLKAKFLEHARKGYLDASRLKPNEKYPKDKIAEIDALLSKEDAKKYKELIAKADKLFAAKSYAKAKEAYVDASDLSPKEKYPKDKLAELTKIYKKIIFAADKFMLDGDYPHATDSYNEALLVNPDEQYPKDQLKEIEKKTHSIDKTVDYAALIKNGDAAFREKNYMTAKDAFTAALKQKPTEKYPKDKLAEIEKLMDSQTGSVGDRYKIIITRADKAFDGKEYKEAKNAYGEASRLQPKEKYPKEKIVEIDKIEKTMASIDILNIHSAIMTKAELNSQQITQMLLDKHDENVARLNRQKMLKKAHAKHMANLSTKYDTKNPLTRLLDIVDIKDSVETAKYHK